MRPKYLARALGVAAAVVAIGAPVAQAATPAPGYGQFTGCPSPAENSSLFACVHSEVFGGHVNIGNKEVPISVPIPLTGGTGEELKGFTYNSQGGLKPVKEKVPGGVVGLTGLTWLLELLGVEALTLYAVTELAGTPTLAITDISLPIKVHLINPVLGNKCYIGSNSEPIVLNLTTGTTSPPPPTAPITGKNPKASFELSTQIQKLTGGTYVDNSFAAPGANGCTLTLLGILPIGLNSIVDSASGLPAAAGTNEAVQEINTEIAPVAKVYP